MLTLIVLVLEKIYFQKSSYSQKEDYFTAVWETFFNVSQNLHKRNISQKIGLFLSDVSK